MVIDKVKLERQQIGVERWFSSSQFGANKDKEGTFNYYTGVGKTFTAILAMKRLFAQDVLHNIIVVVPSDSLTFQWQLVLSEHFNKKELNRIEVFSASFILNNDYKIKTNTLVVDELHLFLGEEYFKVIDGTYIKADNRLALTATYNDPKGRHEKYINLYPVIDTIGEKEAIERGFVSPYLEFNLKVPFTDEELENYKKYTEVITKNFSKFGKGGLDLATKCLSGGKHKGKKFDAVGFCYAWAKHNGWHDGLNMDDENQRLIHDMWNPRTIMGYAKVLMRAIRFRKELLYNSYYKALITVKIVEKFKGEKIIVFGQKTKYADDVHEMLNEKYPGLSVVYHSQIKTQLLPSPKTGKLIKYGSKRLKKIAIDAIKTGKAKVIATASSLDTGFDVNDILIGIIGSGTQNFNQHKQRGGRVKRISDVLAKDKRKLIVNLYIPNTKDETWLKKRQSQSTNTIYWIDTVEEISFNPIDTNEFNIETI